MQQGKEHTALPLVTSVSAMLRDKANENTELGDQADAALRRAGLDGVDLPDDAA
jgi:hypothetical protein